MFPILVVGADGVVCQANERARQLLGAAVGRCCAEVVRGRGRSKGTGCTRDCPHRLLAGDRRFKDQIVSTRGERRRLLCSRVDQTVVVIAYDVGEVPVQSLTEREREVLQLVAEGLTTRQIGETLRITMATARTHVEHIRDKLGARTRTEAVARALALGLLGPRTAPPG